MHAGSVIAQCVQPAHTCNTRLALSCAKADEEALHTARGHQRDSMRRKLGMAEAEASAIPADGGGQPGCI